MRVLMVNVPGAMRFLGGDLTQMRETAAALRRLGVEVAESFDPAPDGRGFDVAHVFNLRTVAVTPGQVEALASYGIPIVLSPIYIDPSVSLWGIQALDGLFNAEHEPHERERLLGQFASRQLWLKNAAGATVTAHSVNRSRPDYDDLQRRVLDRVRHLLPNSMLEMSQLAKSLRVCNLPFTVVPYGVDPGVFLAPDPEPFVKEHGIRDFVLQAGRIEPSKNQLMLCHALRDAEVPLVLIGGQLNPMYVQICKKFGPRDLRVLDRLPVEKLRHAYAAARVHALPSWVETCGLVSLEAALADCTVVASIAGHEMEYLQEEAYYCDPADAASIRNAVLSAMGNYDTDQQRRERLRQRILREYTWDRAAEETLAAYQRALGHG